MQRRFGIAVIGFALLGAGCLAASPQTEATTAIADESATITTDFSAYNFAQSVVVNWTGLPGDATDWVALAPQGSDPTVVTRWTYTGSSASGSAALEGPGSGGTYVARAFADDSYTIAAESPPFTVADSSSSMVTIVTDLSQYAVNQDVVVTWTGLPGNDKDWIALAPQGSSTAVTTTWVYTDGRANGTHTFSGGIFESGYPPGSYVARAFLNDTFTEANESTPFNEGGSLTTDTSSYQAQQTITVTWNNLPGNTNDWIALADAASDPTDTSSVIIWKYTGGGTTGNLSFSPGLTTAGTYVARGYVNDMFVFDATSPSFTVAGFAAVTVSTDMSMYAIGQSVTATWTGLPGNAHDWIALAPQGSDPTDTPRWVYTGGAMSGSYTFEGLSTAGTYVARAFVNDTYTELGESSPFVVQ